MRAPNLGLTLGFSLAVATVACSASRTQVQPELASVTLNADCPPGVDAQAMATGKKAYMRLCVSCHQIDGRGLPGIFPPVAGHAPRLAQSAAGRAYLLRLMLWGLTGPITVDGTIYQNVMPPQAALLTDVEVASVLTYVMHAFDNCRSFTQTPLFAAEEVHKLRQSPDSGFGTYNLRKTTYFAAQPQSP